MRGVLVLACLIGLSACFTPPSVKPAKKSAAQRKRIMPASGLLLKDTAGLPPALKTVPPLWETLTAGRTAGEPTTGTRLYLSGELFGYGATRRTYQHDTVGREPASPAWRLDARLNPGRYRRRSETAGEGIRPTQQ